MHKYLVKSITLQKALVADLLVPTSFVLLIFSTVGHFVKWNFFFFLSFVRLCFWSFWELGLVWKDEAVAGHFYMGMKGPVWTGWDCWTAHQKRPGVGGVCILVCGNRVPLIRALGIICCGLVVSFLSYDIIFLHLRCHYII